MTIGRFLIFAGLLLLAWGIASWFVPFSEGDPFYTDAAYSIFYMAIGALITWSGVTWNTDIRHAFASLIGVLFIAISILGWVVADRATPSAWVTHLGMVDNIVHLALGLVFILAGVAAKTDEVYPEPAGTTMNYR